MSRFLLVLAVALIPAAALANIPDPDQSTTPDCIVLCPESDITQTVTVRDQNGNEMANTEVRMIFSAECEDLICWCPGQDHPVITLTTDANGVVTFVVDAGGCCMASPPGQGGGPNTVVIEADPGAVVLNSYTDVASPDMHSDAVGGDPWGQGDCDVDLNDFVRFASVFLTNNCCGNLNDDNPNDGDCICNVNLNDFVVFASHFLHNCP